MCYALACRRISMRRIKIQHNRAAIIIMSFKSVFKLFVVIAWCVFGYTTVRAQGNLMRVVALNDVNHQQIGTVLKKISGTGNFNFVYNNQTIPADSVISVTGYHGTIYNFLNNVLGPDYEFKEVPGYIVLRHAPRKLLLAAEVDNDPGKQLTVRGHVSDAADGRRLGHVSIFEKNLLVSTLTDEQGDFALKLNSWTGAVLLTATKENYRDTSLFILQDVNVISKATKKHYEYYPEGEQTGGSFRRSFAHLFISSKQMIQNLNLGGFFAFSPYQISLVPGLSSHGMYNSQVIDNFSFNILGGYTAGIKGVELGGLFNINRADVSFLQLGGIFNIVGGNTKGVQAAGVYNQVLNNASGVQMAGIVNKVKVFKGGLQAAGVSNIADGFWGVEVAGVYNKSNTFNGVQLAGLMNQTQTGKGLQLAGLVNKSKEKITSQIAGIANIASKVSGLQFAGLFNVADTSDYPLAFVNFIKSGRKTLSVSTDQFLFTHVDFRSGGRVLYGIIGGGYKFSDDQAKYAVELGYGAHIINHTRFTLDAEYGYQTAFGDKKKSYQSSSFKLLPGFKLNHTLQLFAGPSINFTSFNRDSKVDLPVWVLNRAANIDNVDVLHIGITGGLQIEL